MKRILLLTYFLLSVVLIMGKTTRINNSKQAVILKFGSMSNIQKSVKFRMFEQQVLNKSKINRKPEFALKSAQAVKQRLDSYTYQEEGDKGKTEFVYDVNGLLTQESEYYWDETTGKMILDSKSESTYDTSNNLVQYVSTYLDETTNQFVIEDKTTYSYDNNGNMTQSINNYWDTTNNQAREYKTDYTYDSSGKLVQEIGSRLDENTNQLVISYKTEYKYNGSGNETQHIYYYWDSYFSNQWEPSTKFESTYDANGNLILSINSTANNFNNTWTWTPNGKDENTYNTKGQLTQNLNYNMDNGLWKVSSKEVYVFDGNGNNTQDLYYNNWDIQTNQWKDIYKDEYTYDNRYTKNDLILPFGEDDAIFTHMITEMNGFYLDSTTNEWVQDYQVSLAYSPQNVTAVIQPNAEQVSVFPNPCSEFVSVNIPGNYSRVSFELFDAQGRKLLSKEIGNNEKISIRSLNSGMYLYNLNTDGKIIRGKLVKE